MTLMFQESPKLMSELMLAATADPNDCFEQQTSRMSVDELRKALDGKGLDVDGSREVLIARLKEEEGQLNGTVSDDSDF